MLTKKKLKEYGLPSTPKKILKRLSLMGGRAQSIAASHIWFRLCDSHSRDEMAEIKGMINYDRTPTHPQVAIDALMQFGFPGDYANQALKSSRHHGEVYHARA